jgi:hypothetical protein
VSFVRFRAPLPYVQWFFLNIKMEFEIIPHDAYVPRISFLRQKKMHHGIKTKFFKKLGVFGANPAIRYNLIYRTGT